MITHHFWDYHGSPVVVASSSVASMASGTASGAASDGAQDAVQLAAELRQLLAEKRRSWGNCAGNGENDRCGHMGTDQYLLIPFLGE